MYKKRDKKWLKTIQYIQKKDGKKKTPLYEG